jgi:hypothetical protein
MWVLHVFEKHGDRLLAEYPLTGIKPELLRRLWNQPDTNPMYDSFPVGITQVSLIGKFSTAPIDLDKFAYFVEYQADT